MRSTRQARPILKWAGGKQAMAARLVGHFPRRFARYYEPFIGGASVFLAVRPDRAVIGDLNDWLLDTYRAVRDDHERVARILDGLANTRGEFDRIRRIPPGTLDAFQKAAHLIYLNKTGFRGLFRVNRKGEFNVPYGAYDRRYYDASNLEAMAERLRHVDIRHEDFERCLADAAPDDFAYLDPPYYKQGGYADFDRYTRDKFREADHERLASACRDLDRRGVRWALSNSDTPFVRSLFEGFTIRAIAGRREINLKAAHRGISELLVTNYEGAGA